MSYHFPQGNHSSADHRGSSARAPMLAARPLPVLRNDKPYTKNFVTREIYVPQEIWDAQQVDTATESCFMRKVKKLRSPIHIKLPASTPWGGAYNGSPFPAGFAQLQIAEIVASQSWADTSLATIPGCFVKATHAGQHKDGPNTLGCAELEPFFQVASLEWRYFPRGPKVIYIPDPSKQMTPQQLTKYRVGAAAALNPTVILPPVQRRGHGRQKKQRRNIRDPVGSWSSDESDHVPDADVLPTLPVEDQPSRADVDQNVHSYGLRSTGRTNPVHQSAISSTPHLRSTRGLHKDVSHDTRSEQSERGTVSRVEDLSRLYEDDLTRRGNKTDTLTEAYCVAKARLHKLNAGLNVVVELGVDDHATTTFWSTFDAVLVEESKQDDIRIEIRTECCSDDPTYGNELFSEAVIISMRTEYEKWKMAVLSSKPRLRTSFEQEFMAKREVIDIQFIDGGELLTIRKMCQDFVRGQHIMSNFRATLTYITSDGEVQLAEHGTVDEGGVTTRLLTGAWKALFNGDAAVSLLIA
ncbi:unnamed protein product [Calypogeia fissa]